MSFVALKNHMYVDFSYIRVPTVGKIEWSVLPLDMRQSDSIRIFKEKLTAFVTNQNPTFTFSMIGTMYFTMYMYHYFLPVLNILQPKCNISD